MAFLEVEVKFYIPEPARLQQRLKEAGAVWQRSGFEKNLILDDADEQLKGRRQLLRLRQYGASNAGGTDLKCQQEPQTSHLETTLTHKAAVAPDGQHKVLKETEVVVDNAVAMLQMLAELGYYPVRIYEKWRDYYTLSDTSFDTCLCVDRLPFGHFLEIEAPPQVIRPVAKRLGFDWPRRIIKNYLELHDLLMQDLLLPLEDLTFVNYAGLNVDFSKYLMAVQAGSH